MAQTNTKNGKGGKATAIPNTINNEQINNQKVPVDETVQFVVEGVLSGLSKIVDYAVKSEEIKAENPKKSIQAKNITIKCKELTINL